MYGLESQETDLKIDSVSYWQPVQAKKYRGDMTKLWKSKNDARRRILATLNLV